MKAIFLSKTFPTLLIALIVNGLHNVSTAQIGYQIVGGGRSAGMANATVALGGDVNAVFQNPASLIGIARPTATLASEWRFGVRDLRPIGAGFALPNPSGVFGFSMQHFGFDNLKQTKIGLAFAKRMTANFTVGAQLDYIGIGSETYGSRSLLTFEIGCNALIFNDLTLSAYVYNPLNVRLTDIERTPSVFRLGAAWSVNPKVIVCLETEKDINFPAAFKFGFEYKVAESVAVRCGVMSQPSAFCFGVGYVVNENFTIDVALSNHSTLGATPALSLNYAFGKNPVKGSEK